MATKTKWYGNDAIRRVETALANALTRMAADVVKEARISMRENKSGIKYKRLVTRSSAPGESPAVQRARLANSVQVEFVDKTTRRVGTNVDYGKHLELGTKHIMPRPWLRPALHKVQSGNLTNYVGRVTK